MNQLTGTTGTNISYTVAGSGPPLVLVHGAFSDHESNWTFVAPSLRTQFTVYALARRGRGDTDATVGHSIEDEARDVGDLLRTLAEPAHVLGHSYGAHCALLAAIHQPARVRTLVLYEPAWPHLVNASALAALETLAAAEAWDQFAYAFFANCLQVPADELDGVRASELWRPIVADARATLGDLRALHAYAFDAKRSAELDIPVLLQIGSESPRSLYVTDALLAQLRNARLDILPGQAHEGMTTAPDQYLRMTTSFLMSAATASATSL